MLGVLVTPQVAEQLMQHRTHQEVQDKNNNQATHPSKEYSLCDPLNFRINPEAVQSEVSQDQRCVTIAEEMPFVKKNVEYPDSYDPTRTRRSSYSTFIAGINQFDPYQELTSTQIAAFRQVFDMVDHDGGGSIDAEELYLSMKDLESGLKLDEIKEILEDLDRDGHGEIDFEEFLYMMTSMSLQVKEAQDNESVSVKQGRRRQSIFFSVITKFAMKHSLKEIERYYASKVKRSPHVVGHYAAGARVFGLTDKELRKTWKEFSHASKGKDSPYAQPLDFLVDDHNGKRLKKTIRPIRRKKENDRLASLNAKLKAKPQPGSRRSLSAQQDASIGGSKKSVIDKNVSGDESSISQKIIYECRSSAPSGSGALTSAEKRDGWTPRHRLPITNVKLPKYTRLKEQKLITIRDMDEIRQRVNDARDTYYVHLSKEKITKAKEYWRSLKTEQIPSDRLQTNFKRVFKCYSPTNDKEFRSQSPRRRNKSPDQDLEIHNSNRNFVFRN